jgi:hypothetical protein
MVLVLDKIAAGIGGLWEIGKKGLKTAALGGLAILSTLAIGAFLIALGKFLGSDSFKKLTEKLKYFHNAFFGEDGSIMTGIKALFSDIDGIGGIVIGIAAATAVFVGFKIAALAAAATAFLAAVSAVAEKIRGVKPIVPAPAAPAPAGAAGAAPARRRRCAPKILQIHLLRTISDSKLERMANRLRELL